MKPYRQRGEFLAFVDGTWVHGPVSTSADGRYEYLTPAAGAGPGE